MDVQNLPRRRPSASENSPVPETPATRSEGAELSRGRRRREPERGGRGAESERTQPVGEGRGREGGGERREAEGVEGGLDPRGGEALLPTRSFVGSLPIKIHQVKYWNIFQRK